MFKVKRTIVSVDNFKCELLEKDYLEPMSYEPMPGIKSWYQITGKIEGKEFYFSLIKERWGWEVAKLV